MSETTNPLTTFQTLNLFNHFTFRPTGNPAIDKLITANHFLRRNSQLFSRDLDVIALHFDHAIDSQLLLHSIKSILKSATLALSALDLTLEEVITEMVKEMEVLTETIEKMDEDGVTK